MVHVTPPIIDHQGRGHVHGPCDPDHPRPPGAWLTCDVGESAALAQAAGGHEGVWQCVDIAL